MVGSSSLSTPAIFSSVITYLVKSLFFVFQALFNTNQVCHYYAMSINQRQYQQLTEMGISLWQHKPIAFHDVTSIQRNAKHQISYLEQNCESLTTLTTQSFFTDILLILGLSIGEITAQKNHLDLGLFNWFFYADPDKMSSIHYADNKLISPSIELIRQSATLKKQLWQTITINLL